MVIYIIGDNRSGSTMLEYLLSCHPHAFSVGELYHLHAYFTKNKGMGALFDWKCSCGETVENCQFWRTILNNIEFSEDYETRLYPRNNQNVWKHRINKLSKWVINDHSINNATTKEGNVIANNIWKLYAEIFSESNRSLIIDSSKNSLQAHFINKHKRSNVKFLLLERDIRAVARSKMKRFQNIPKKIKPYWNPRQKSIYQHIISCYKIKYRNRRLAHKINSSSEIKLVKIVDYYTLSKYTEKEINEICAFLEIEKFIPPKKTYEVFGFAQKHALCGSPSRKKQRDIIPDESWRYFYKNKPIARLFGKILQLL